FQGGTPREPHRYTHVLRDADSAHITGIPAPFLIRHASLSSLHGGSRLSSGACSPRLPRIARQVRTRLPPAAATGVRPRRAVRFAPIDSTCESRSRERSVSAQGGGLPGRALPSAPARPLGGSWVAARPVEVCS